MCICMNAYVGEAWLYFEKILSISTSYFRQVVNLLNTNTSGFTNAFVSVVVVHEYSAAMPQLIVFDSVFKFVERQD